MEFVEPIYPLEKRNGAWYIIVVIDYLTRWVEAAPVVYCIVAKTVIFLFENIVTQFGCLRIFMSDQGTHFINRTVSALIEEL